MVKLFTLLLLVFTLTFGSLLGQDESCFAEEKLETEEELSEDAVFEEENVDVIFTFTNAVKNEIIQKQFTLMVTSLFQHATVAMNIHILGEKESQVLAEQILKDNVPPSANYKTIRLDVNKLASEFSEIVRPMQERFSSGPATMYYHPLFYLSCVIHRVMPSSMHRVIMMDVDLKFRGDIRLLFDQFNHFSHTHILGLANDMQPTYRFLFHRYRVAHPYTRVGGPPPTGLPGFNSGVLLLDLDRMRKSELYNSLLNREKIEDLADEFSFKGLLGDQDFYALVNIVHEKLFYVLPCVFNYQLCTAVKDVGYVFHSVFHLYYVCEGDVVIYHGNCQAPFPDD